MKIKDSKFIGEFKEFISQGSVMDLAVGMVIGTAFTSIVNSAVNDMIMPLVGILIGGVDFSSLSLVVPNVFGGDTAAVVRYGNFLQNVVNFLVIAFALFLVVKVMNGLRRKTRPVKEEKKEKESKKDSKKN